MWSTSVVMFAIVAQLHLKAEMKKDLALLLLMIWY